MVGRSKFECAAAGASAPERAASQGAEGDVGGGGSAAPPHSSLPDIYHSGEIPTPLTRPLQVFAFDPAISSLIGNIMTANVSYEKLSPGPVGNRFAVIDYDGANKCFYKPVDLSDERLQVGGGLAPNEADPRFHQQMVYAIASETLQRFESALGRKIHWKQVDKETAGAARREQAGLSPREASNRLNLFPHAIREANAFYCREAHGILFGYFKASQAPMGRLLPGQTVFTCLSHDIIAHETTHAIVDGIRQYFIEATNVDAPAFHEAFADIAALFSHFSHREVLLDTLKKTGGRLFQFQLQPEAYHERSAEKPKTQAELAKDNPLIGLATQFGQALGMRHSLRGALGTEPNSHDLNKKFEPHERGSILVAAVFDAYFTIFTRRTADLFSIWRARGGGAGDDIPAPLAERLADEASRTAEQFFVICARALDYCPPVDITFGDYLRAILTADLDLHANDPDGLRDAIMEAFRLRGIFPEGADSYSEKSLFWPCVDEAELPALPGLLFGDPNGLTKEEKNVNGTLLRNYASKNGHLFGLDPKDGKIDVPSFHPMFHLAPDGSLYVNMVVEFVQTMHLPRDETESAAFPMRNGVTLLIVQNRVENNQRPPPKVLFAIPKLYSKEREQRIRDYFRASGMAFQALSETPFQIDFGILHTGVEP